MGCGCEQRQDRLNQWRPGFGDKVKLIADPVKEAAMSSGAKFVLGMIVGFYVIPWAMRVFAETRG